MKLAEEIGCHNCFGACCIGPQTMQLSVLEKAQLRRAGTVLQAVAEPVDYDRQDVLYPVGVEINEERQTLRWMVNPNNPTEPLPAGYGRYMLLGACGNLRKAVDGTYSCAIYDHRPQDCRDFEEGGEKCQLMHATKVEINPRKPAVGNPLFDL